MSYQAQDQAQAEKTAAAIKEEIFQALSAGDLLKIEELIGRLEAVGAIPSFKAAEILTMIRRLKIQAGTQVQTMGGRMRRIIASRKAKLATALASL